MTPAELRTLAQSGGTGMGEYLLQVADAWEADRKALEDARGFVPKLERWKLSYKYEQSYYPSPGTTWQSFQDRIREIDALLAVICTPAQLEHPFYETHCTHCDQPLNDGRCLNCDD